MTTNPDTETEAGVVAALAIAAAEPGGIDIDGATVLAGAYPPGWDVMLTDLERFERTPRRSTGTATFHDTASLLAYIRRQLTPDQVTAGDQPPVYLNPERFTATAVFNDHDAYGAGWRDHRAVLELKATDEWRAWTAVDKRYLSAQEFAEHIEEWRHTVWNPPTADLLDMVRSFRATTKVSFRDEVVEKSGDRALEYVTETTATAGRTGKLEIPDGFDLNLAPFDGADPQALAARFRYRIDEGTAVFGVVLDQPKLLAKAAFAAEVAKLTAADLTTMVGSPA